MDDPSFFSPEEFSEYMKQLIKELCTLHVPDEKVAEIISYAETLQRYQVPIIFDQPHLAALLGYDLDYLQVISTCKEDFYKEYRIPKRSGGERIIQEPFPNLKEIQKWILDNILTAPGILRLIPKTVTAFMPGRDIIYNSQPHVGKRTVICMDLKDFFPSISWFQVYVVFADLGYRKDVAGMLAHLCTLGGNLPQGAPTSPMLSNIVMLSVDRLISRFCESRGISYSRYADDLTFSMDGRFDYGRLMGYVRIVMEKARFKINEKKTKVFHRNHSQIVTGIVVNDHLQVSRSYRKKIRQEMYFLQKHGLKNHYARIEYRFSQDVYLHHLLGKVNFVLYVNPSDNEMQRYCQILKEMLKTAENVSYYPDA